VFEASWLSDAIVMVFEVYEKPHESVTADKRNDKENELGGENPK